MLISTGQLALIHCLAAANALPGIAPVVLLVLCVVAGIGTVLMLPGRREAGFAKIGGAVLLATGLIFAAVLVWYVAGGASTEEKTGLGPFFWIFAVTAIFGAIRVITHPKPVYSALYFVLTVMASAGLFVLLWAEFMAAALVLIYAGAILVTYVFVIMLAASVTADGKPLGGLAEHDAVSREPVLASAVGFGLMGLLLMLIFNRGTQLAAGPEPTVFSTAQLGIYLFQNQVVNLVLSGILMVVGMVGAIAIARRQVVGESVVEESLPTVVERASLVTDDNPHDIPVAGADNPRAKTHPWA